MFAESFVVPDTWFGVFDDMRPIVQVSLDGSYSRFDHPHRVFAYAGLFGYEDAWKAMVPLWLEAMPAGVGVFRTNDLRDRSDFTELRATLGGICADVGLHAVGRAARAELLDPTSEAKRKKEVFLLVVGDLLTAAPSTVNLALLCDREQDLAKEIHNWMDRERSRRSQPGNVYDRITGICYFNSRMSIQIQAADLVASLFRDFAERKELDTNAEPDPVLKRLTPHGIKAAWVVRLDGPGLGE